MLFLFSSFPLFSPVQKRSKKNRTNYSLPTESTAVKSALSRWFYSLFDGLPGAFWLTDAQLQYFTLWNKKTVWQNMICLTNSTLASKFHGNYGRLCYSFWYVFSISTTLSTLILPISSSFSHKKSSEIGKIRISFSQHFHNVESWECHFANHCIKLLYKNPKIHVFSHDTVCLYSIMRGHIFTVECGFPALLLPWRMILCFCTVSWFCLNSGTTVQHFVMLAPDLDAIDYLHEYPATIGDFDLHICPCFWLKVTAPAHANVWI